MQPINAAVNIFSAFMKMEKENPLTKILFAAISLIIGVALSVLFAGLTKRLFRRIGKGNKIFDSRRFNTFASVLSVVIRSLILFLAVLQALIFLGLNSVVTSLSATVGISTIVITISVQSLLRDIFAGLFMLLENDLSVGDYVTISGLSGRVEKFTLRRTTVRADTGESHHLLNGAIVSLTNYSKGHTQIKADIPFSNACDPFHTMKLLQAGVEKEFPNSHAVVHQILSVDANSYTVRAMCDCPIGRKVDRERELMDCIIRIMAEKKIALPNGVIPIVGEPVQKS